MPQAAAETESLSVIEIHGNGKDPRLNLERLYQVVRRGMGKCVGNGIKDEC
jgi:hypothetical protein